MIARLLAAAVTVLLAPAAAWACASCVASAYGDRTFNWAMLALIVMPFLVAAGVGVVIYWWYSEFRAIDGLAPEENS